MSLTDAQVKALLVGGMPPGTEVLYPYNAGTSNISMLFSGLATGHNATAYAYLDTLTQERNPLTIVEDVPDWEEALGLDASRLALTGTPVQRRAQVDSKLRETGDASFASIRAIMQPFFNYADPTQIQIIETDRAQLTAAHTYPFLSSPLTITALQQVILTVIVADGPMCSRAGAQLFFEFTGDIQDFTFTLEGPGGQPVDIGEYFTVGYAAVANANFCLAFINFVDRPIAGTWRLIVKSGSGNSATLTICGVFVEAIGLNPDGSQGLGGAIHEWAVVFDPSLVAPGASYDLLGAQAALTRVKPAHTNARVVVAGAPGQAFAIPDTLSATPDAALPD